MKTIKIRQFVPNPEVSNAKANYAIYKNKTFMCSLQRLLVSFQKKTFKNRLFLDQYSKQKTN